MKAFVFSLCVLACISFISAETGREKVYKAVSSAKRREMQENVNTCLSEVDITKEEIFDEEEIISEVYLRSDMEERKRKNGCFVECVLKKLDMMEGTEIKEQKIQAEISKEMADHPMEPKVHKVAHDCVKEVKNITHECEKGMGLMVCTGKAVHKFAGHEEHQQPPT